MRHIFVICTRCYGSGDSPDSNGDNQYPCELCGGSGCQEDADAARFTLIDADGMILAIDEWQGWQHPQGAIDERLAISFWSVDGELYELLPHTYTVLERGVERAAAFAACGEVDDADG